MKGWSFISFDKRGRPTAQGTVVEKVGDEEWLCYFQAGPKSNGQIVTASDMRSWQLFPDNEALNEYMRSVAEEQAAQQKQAADAAGGDGGGDTPGDAEDDGGASELELDPNAEGEVPQENANESSSDSDSETPGGKTDD